MTDADDLQSIRKAKKERLKEQFGDVDTDSSHGDDRTGPDATVREPIHVGGPDHLGDVTNSHDVVLVDFYADWCGPCKMVEPVLEALHDDGIAVVAKVDIDEHQEIAQHQNVRGVPTMLLFVDGTPVDRVVGATDRASLEALVDKHT